MYEFGLMYFLQIFYLKLDLGRYIYVTNEQKFTPSLYDISAGILKGCEYDKLDRF
jgi:hypothetical protein